MVDSNETSISNAEIQELKERVRELEGIVEDLTERNHFLSEALAKVARSRLSPPPISSSGNPPSADGYPKILELPKGRIKPFKPII